MQTVNNYAMSLIWTCSSIVMENIYFQLHLMSKVLHIITILLYFAYKYNAHVKHVSVNCSYEMHKYWKSCMYSINTRVATQLLKGRNER